MIGWISAVAAALVLVVAPAAADEARVIYIRVDGAPQFDVVYHRALTDVTGAVIGGLIGAGIQAGIESDRDTQKREELKPHVAENVWQDVFVRTLSEALVAKGFEPVWAEGKDLPKDAKVDVYLVIYPASYGFRMVDSTSMLVSAYVEFAASYAREPIKPHRSSSRSSPRESFYLADKKRAHYDELLQAGSALNGEVETVLAQAARRLANKVIYNAK
jgi:hypothetical protein